MLREGCWSPCARPSLRAGKDEAPVREEGLRVKSDGGWRDGRRRGDPGQGATRGARTACFLVLFDDAGQPSGASATTARTAARAARRRRAAGEPSTSTSLACEHELAATREYLQSVIEQQEAANEELQSANEEVQSANEELQSINEELETSKEEIQSSNEELPRSTTS